MNQVFVYGTLKRDGSNHGFLAGECFMGEARTVAGYALYELKGYPGMVRDPASTEGVTGELWSVSDVCLAKLDELEGTQEGLYARERIALHPPWDHVAAEAYLYLKSVANRRRVTDGWVG